MTHEDRKGVRATTSEAASQVAPQVTPEVARLLEGLLPEQSTIVTTLDRPVFVAAGAGSGKTFTLTRRIVWALCPGSGANGRPFLDSLDQALVITFTEKAAGEIKERVRSALREAGLADEALKVDSAWVSTIHHMCARILRSHALDLGLDPSFSMLGEQAAVVLKSQATETALAALEGEPALSALFDEYGVQGRSGVPALVSALREKAAAAERGLDSLSFTEARVDVAGVMRSLADAYEALCACDSKYEDELEKCREALGKLRGFWDLPPARRTADRAAELVEGLYRPNGNKWRAKAVKDFCREAKELAAAAAGELALARVQALQEPLMLLARTVDALYADAKAQLGALDNDDLLQLVSKAFREHPDIAREYAGKFRLVMVDEFQDTNGQQVGMVKGLSGPDACHLTTVGDAQQAIYGFRGADVGVFEARGREVGGAGTVRLDYNFRSNDAILRFVARVCGDTGIVPAFMDLRAKQRPNASFPEASHPRVCVELTRAHRLGRAVVARAERTRLAAAQLADRLAQIRAAGVPAREMAVLMRSLGGADAYIQALRARGLESVVVGGSTFSSAPEVRTVLSLLRTLANPRDTKSGLFPVLESGMFSLDANDLLILATKPQEVLDAPAKRRIYPGARDDAPDFGGVRPSERLVAARRVLSRAWGRVGRMPVADVCLMAVRESGWLARLEDRGVEGRAVAANVLSAIRHVRELAAPDALDAVLAADEFAGWLDAAKEGPASLSGEGLDAVSLMTAHASKGLEFRVVAVVGCCGSETSRPAPRILSRREGDRLLVSLAPASFSAPDLGEDAPTEPADCTSPLEWRALMESEHAEAERLEDGRLLYVALTRARECVVLCLDATERAKGGLSPAMTDQIVSGLFGERPLAGESRFDYGGTARGLARVVDVTPSAEGDLDVDSGDTLDLDDGQGPAAGSCVRSEPADGLALAGDASAGFRIPDPSFTAETEVPLGTWRPREGVYSYSSARKPVGSTTGGAESGIGVGLGELGGTHPAESDSVGARDDLASSLGLPVPVSVQVSAPMTGAAGSGDAGSSVRGRASFLTRAVALRIPLEDDGEQANVDDADRATSFGTAFHELARYLVETGRMPDERRVALACASFGVGRFDRTRLSDALARWEGSSLREEVLGYARVRAEVPFFLEAACPFGRELEGAIDLLATSDGSGRALLVDYKTGDRGASAKEIGRRHQLQARTYAYVLRRMGFTDVTCAFVCVELDDGTGEPVVARYEFAL